MLGRKVAAVAMSAVLAVSLCPGLAVASQLEAGQASAEAALSTQASGTTVYVLDKASYTYTSSYTTYTYERAAGGSYAYDEEDDDYYYVGEGEGSYNRVEKTVKQPYTYSRNFSYNKNGLLSSYNGYTFTYSGVNLKKVASSYSTYNMKTSNGKVKSATAKYTYNSGNKEQYTYSYDGSGNLVSEKRGSYSKYYYGKTNKSAKKTSTYTTNYTNKKGKIVKSSYSRKDIDGSTYTSGVTTYAYDGKGNLKQSRYSKNTPYKYTNTYKNGRVATHKVGSDGTKYTFTYKAVKVSASAAKVAKAQQWAIINNNMNRAFGPFEGFYF